MLGMKNWNLILVMPFIKVKLLVCNLFVCDHMEKGLFEAACLAKKIIEIFEVLLKKSDYELYR